MPGGTPPVVLDLVETGLAIDAEGLIRLTVLGSTPDKFERLQRTVDAALGARS